MYKKVLLSNIIEHLFEQRYCLQGWLKVGHTAHAFTGGRRAQHEAATATLDFSSEAALRQNFGIVKVDTKMKLTSGKSQY